MDMQNPMAMLSGLGIGFGILAVLIGILVSAAVMLLSMKVTRTPNHSYLKAIGVVVLAGIVGFVVSLLLGMVLGGGFLMMAINIVASLLITAGFITLLCKSPYPRAIGTAALYWVFFIVFMVLFGVVMSMLH